MEKKADRISGFVGLLFAIFMGIHSYLLGMGALNKPGPGFLFFWTSVALAGLSVSVIIRGFIGRKTEKGGRIFGRKNLLKIVLVYGSLFLYAIFMEWLGFILITLMLFLFLMGFIEKKKWPLTIFISVAVTVVSYLVFEVWLRSQLPKGILESLRF